MILAINELSILSEGLNVLVDTNILIDYRVILQYDMSVNVYIILHTYNYEYKQKVKDIFNSSKIQKDIEFYTVENLKEDDFLQTIFKNSTKIDLGSRRNLSNLLHASSIRKSVTCPVVSFYSYKGGVGRTTALALFATYLTNHHGKKVFVLDYDLEAPGLINFFGIIEDGIPKEGVVEYIKNKEYDPSLCLSNDYVYEISRRYSGDGSLFIMPAGNILTKNDRDDFLEGLARLDYFGTHQFFHKLNELLLEIDKLYKPDIILIDSRTGFNDISGLLINNISDIVVGLFGNNIQNEPGLYFFLDTFLKNKSLGSLVLVNSIISKSISKSTASFKDKIDTYLKEELNDEFESLPAIPVYGFVRNSILEDIGTEQEDLDDFITLVRNKTLNDYVECFEHLLSLVNDITETVACVNEVDNVYIQSDSKQQEEVTNNESETITSDYFTDLLPAKFSKFHKKEKLLTSLDDNFPVQYAEDITFTSNFINEQFYIRKSMENIFIQDKFILLGGKGTGKTAFYLALQNNTFFYNLQKRSQKDHQKFFTMKGVSLPNESGSDVFYFDIANFNQDEINDTDFFYRRFWITYIWLIIYHNKATSDIVPSIQIFNISNDSITANNFKELIYDDSSFSKVEQDITKANILLNSRDLNCIVLFDQLDKIVKPVLWSKAITPLINYCHSIRFERIHFKLFIRRDLFNKLSNLTNKNQLERRSIDLEWSIDEIFDFFFKIIFAHAKDDFLSCLVEYKRIPSGTIKKITSTINKSNSFNQLNADIFMLRPLVEAFFGKHADPKGTMRYGESYEWFYKNLRNADLTISLRPFLDLIGFALKRAKESNSLNPGYFPVLHPNLFNADARSYAVERHLSDLAGEEGNELLKVVIDDIRNDKVPKNLKLTSLLQDEFERMAKIIIENNDGLHGKTVSDIESILELNGITATSFRPGGGKVHAFAYLYKYYLGLKGIKKDRQENKGRV